MIMWHVAFWNIHYKQRAHRARVNTRHSNIVILHSSLKRVPKHNLQKGEKNMS